MKTYKRIFIIFCCTLILSTNIFMCYSMPVFAKPTLDENGHLHVYNWDDIKDCAVDWVMYMASLAGAIFTDHDFATYVQNKESWVDYWKEDNVKISENGTSVTFSKELMAFIKQCIDDYAKENEPYFIVPTTSINDVNPAQFTYKAGYKTLCNLVDKYGLVGVNGTSDRMFVSDLSDFYKTDCGFIYCKSYPVGRDWSTSVCEVRVCDSNWQSKPYYFYFFNFDQDTSAYTSLEEGIYAPDSSFTVCSHMYFLLNSALARSGNIKNDNSTIDHSRMASLVSKDSSRVRVYATLDDFKQYSVGKRSVYYTSNYYNYVPEDLSVSIDDLQKEIDDLSKVIDQLLDQISKDTDESEIEELLRQILEALKNQQGTGGGGTGGGGDVTVDIDLSTTNGLLSKILAKVTQIFDKLSSSAGNTFDDVVNAISDLHLNLKFDEIIKYLKEITGDLDDIKGQLEDMSEEEVEEKTDSFLKELMDMFSDITEEAKGKFPFSLPSDLQFLIGRISGMSPEAAASYSYDADMVSSLSLHTDYSLNSVMEIDGADHGGGGASRPGEETEPPGGGGASRPGGSGFISVEHGGGGDPDHGGGGASREPVSSNNWAPVFTLPIVIERYGIEEYVIIDMSMFDPVSKMSRTLFLIMYIICLYNMTFKVMGLWGDLVG